MKIRKGFVSNSSSSSFTLILTEDGLKEAQEKLCTVINEAILEIFKKKEVFGKSCYIFSTWNSAGGGKFDDRSPFSNDLEERLIEEFGEEEYPLYEVLDILEETISEDNIFSVEQDW